MEDRGVLPTMSYSKIDTFENCQRRFEKQYVQRLRGEGSTIALELGSILHKGLEMKGNYLINKEDVDYDEIQNAVLNGCDEETEKDSGHMNGINEIKAAYSDEWLKSLEDTENMSYPQKIDIYLKEVLPTRMEDPNWEVIGVEVPFEYVYDNRCIVHGFIDRIDRRVDDESILRVVDYKSSKKVFIDSKIKTPLQMIVYDLACLQIYGVIPQYHEYDFILLNQKQASEDGVCSKGYLNRGLKKINNLLDKIDEAEAKGEYPPSPTPLCYWCPYAPIIHTPNADKKYGGECQYYSLWIPEHKQFAVNQPYVPGEPEKVVRKLVF